MLYMFDMRRGEGLRLLMIYSSANMHDKYLDLHSIVSLPICIMAVSLFTYVQIKIYIYSFATRRAMIGSGWCHVCS